MQWVWRVFRDYPALKVWLVRLGLVVIGGLLALLVWLALLVLSARPAPLE